MYSHTPYVSGFDSVATGDLRGRRRRTFANWGSSSADRWRVGGLRNRRPATLRTHAAPRPQRTHTECAASAQICNANFSYLALRVAKQYCSLLKLGARVVLATATFAAAEA